MFDRRTDDASLFSSALLLEPAIPTTVSVPRPSRCLVVEVLPGRLPVQHATDTYRRMALDVSTGAQTQPGYQTTTANQAGCPIASKLGFDDVKKRPRRN